MPFFLFSMAASLLASPSAQEQEQLKERFDAARQLVTEEKFEEALRRFEGILEVDPNARGSLLMSGLVHNRLYQFDRAALFFDRFLALEPEHVSGALGALKAYQSSGQEEKADLLRDRVMAFRREGVDPRLSRMLNFEREARRLDDGRAISVLEMFPGNTSGTWKLVLMGKDLKQILRRMEWKLADSSELALMGMGPDDPPLWILGEPLYDKEGLSDYKIRKFHEGSLDYRQAVNIGIKELLAPLQD